MTKKAHKAAAPPTDPIDTFIAQANANQWNALAILLWKARHDNPSFTVEITEQDLSGFKKCIEYLEVEPKVAIFRPGAIPAREALPATANREALPARPALAGKPYALLQMTDTDGNAIVAVEDNDDDFKKSKETNRVRQIKGTANALAAQLIADVQGNNLSNATILEAAEALKVLAK